MIKTLKDAHKRVQTDEDLEKVARELAVPSRMLKRRVRGNRGKAYKQASINQLRSSAGVEPLE